MNFINFPPQPKNTLGDIFSNQNISRIVADCKTSGTKQIESLNEIYCIFTSNNIVPEPALSTIINSVVDVLKLEDISLDASFLALQCVSEMTNNLNAANSFIVAGGCSALSKYIDPSVSLPSLELAISSTKKLTRTNSLHVGKEIGISRIIHSIGVLNSKYYTQAIDIVNSIASVGSDADPNSSILEILDVFEILNNSSLVDSMKSMMKTITVENLSDEFCKRIFSFLTGPSENKTGILKIANEIMTYKADYIFEFEINFSNLLENNSTLTDTISILKKAFSQVSSDEYKQKIENLVITVQENLIITVQEKVIQILTTEKNKFKVEDPDQLQFEALSCLCTTLSYNLPQLTSELMAGIQKLAINCVNNTNNNLNNNFNNNFNDNFINRFNMNNKVYEVTLETILDIAQYYSHELDLADSYLIDVLSRSKLKSTNNEYKNKCKSLKSELNKVIPKIPTKTILKKLTFPQVVQLIKDRKITHSQFLTNGLPEILLNIINNLNDYQGNNDKEVSLEISSEDAQFIVDYCLKLIPMIPVYKNNNNKNSIGELFLNLENNCAYSYNGISLNIHRFAFMSAIEWLINLKSFGLNKDRLLRYARKFPGMRRIIGNEIINSEWPSQYAIYYRSLNHPQYQRKVIVVNGKKYTHNDCQYRVYAEANGHLPSFGINFLTEDDNDTLASLPELQINQINEILPILNLLECLYKYSKNKLPINFSNNKLGTYIKSLIDPSEAILLKSAAHYTIERYPFLFDFYTRLFSMKIRVFPVYNSLRVLAREEDDDFPPNDDQVVHIQIRRKKIFCDGIKVLRTIARNPESLDVSFTGEEGRGPGPTHEFFTLLSRCFCQLRRGIFRSTQQFSQATSQIPWQDLLMSQSQSQDPNYALEQSIIREHYREILNQKIIGQKEDLSQFNKESSRRESQSNLENPVENSSHKNKFDKDFDRYIDSSSNSQMLSDLEFSQNLTNSLRMNFSEDSMNINDSNLSDSSQNNLNSVNHSDSSESTSSSENLENDDSNKNYNNEERYSESDYTSSYNYSDSENRQESNTTEEDENEEDENEEEEEMNQLVPYCHDPLGMFPSKNADPELMEDLGTLCAKAVLQEASVDVRFSPYFFKLCRGEEVKLEDVDPQLARSLSDTSVLADSWLTFDYMGEELVPNGLSISVTQENAEEYVKLITDWVVGEKVKKVAESFVKGFSRLLSFSALDGFTADEICDVFCGADKHITRREFLDSVRFEGGYDKNSPQASMLANVIAGMSREEQRSFIMFVTGYRRLPVGGLSSLSPRLSVTVYKCDNNDEALPTVSTCTSTLKVPLYSNEKIMSTKLMKAIAEGCSGFQFI
ncbi:hypothetical protein TRFO_01808 [Tritrichomonas foetus]|uniref:HECT domain-containing protein n=1 Tax=Tritrichomonas foetus TaxID=1144522 RepID=A0A1J4JJI3_9EUKA|nr:hypothetical protein TRFO_01808 [Tritrichomonas foetus]|eukprot:OHS98769.1 hypothetical protein TRFO_01808 [Tritrichomonas foetus]